MPTTWTPRGNRNHLGVQWRNGDACRQFRCRFYYLRADRIRHSVCLGSPWSLLGMRMSVAAGIIVGMGEMNTGGTVCPAWGCWLFVNAPRVVDSPRAQLP
jgi:hypothetical protein